MPTPATTFASAPSIAVPVRNMPSLGLEVHGPPRPHSPRLPGLPLALLRESAQVVAVRLLLVLQPPRQPHPSREPAPLPDHEEADEAPRGRFLALQASTMLQVRREAAELREGGPVDHGRLDRRGTQRAGEGPVAGRFNAKVAREILQFVTDDDCRFMGFDPTTTRPENMVLTVMLVPSVIIRPTTSIQESSRTKGHDDLTTLLRDIVKYSNLVREKLEEKPGRVPHPGLRATRRPRLHVLRQGRRGHHRNDVSWRHGRGEDHAKAHHRSGPLKSLGKRLGGSRGGSATPSSGKGATSRAAASWGRRRTTRFGNFASPSSLPRPRPCPPA